jgi:ATP-dependent RNA helicase RhlE
LEKHGIKAMAIHGNKSQVRAKVRSTPLKPKNQCISCNRYCARVSTFLSFFRHQLQHFEEAETYIHRIGRTGRAGAVGVAISFCCSDELSNLRNIEKLIQNPFPKRNALGPYLTWLPLQPHSQKSFHTPPTICTIKAVVPAIVAATD